MNQQIKLISFITLALVIGIGIGYLVIPKTSSKSTLSVMTAGVNKGPFLFDNQTAVIRGKIIHLNQDTAIVENSSGQNAQFKIDPKFIVINPNLKGFTSSGSADLKDIVLNKDVVITLVNKSAETVYRITVIAYLPDNKNTPQLKR